MQYKKELQQLRPQDEIQYLRTDNANAEYNFITTAGHGYLVVPITDKHFILSKKHATYAGQLANYLEEDCDKYNFLEEIKALK